MEVYILRHGQTAWSVSGQHTGHTDIPLTDEGRRQAEALGKRLQGIHFDHVWTSPSQRAQKTAEVAGLKATVDPDLAEWDYGAYEGLTTPQIQEKIPRWTLFTEGASQGESVAQMTARATRVVARLRATGGRIALVSSGHISRAIAACWLGFTAAEGRCLLLSTASLSILGYEHQTPVLVAWNDTSHCY